MNIDYNNYVIFPYTIQYLQKNYTKEVLSKWRDQLAFLYQNGFSFQDNSLTQIEEQMMLFNDFKTYDDFEELKNSFSLSKDPTVIGYKIVDSVLVFILKDSSWAKTQFVDIKKMGNLYKGRISKMLGIVDATINNSDFEVSKVVKRVIPSEAFDLLTECLELADEEKNNILLIKFQKLYELLSQAHTTINRALFTSSEKGKVATVGNVNDELYGSAGYFIPTTKEIKCSNGSAVFELKTLCNSSLSDSELYFKMLVIAKECVANGENDKTIVSFCKGDKSNLSKVRKILTDICFSGIMVLLELKHNITLFDGDTLNKSRAEKMLSELTQICSLTGYKSKELM